MNRLVLVIVAGLVALLAHTPAAHAYQRDACADLSAIAAADPDDNRRNVASQAYIMLDCADAAAGSVRAGAADGPDNSAAVIGDWEGDWGGWTGVWTFRNDGSFSHGYGKGVEEDCRHGNYQVRGSRLTMQYHECSRATVDGTLSGDALTATTSEGVDFTARRR